MGIFSTRNSNGNEVPLIPFIKGKFENQAHISDMQMMDMFAKEHCRGWRYSSIAKKLSSIRKRMWEMKSKGILIEHRRVELSWCSDEIFYRLNNDNERSI